MTAGFPRQALRREGDSGMDDKTCRTCGHGWTAWQCLEPEGRESHARVVECFHPNATREVDQGLCGLYMEPEDACIWRDQWIPKKKGRRKPVESTCPTS